MKKAITILISLITLLSSCIDEFDKEFNNIEPQIVVNSFFNSDEPFKVYISKTYSPFIDGNLEIIKNAEIKVYENENLLGSLTFQKNTFEYNDMLIDGIDTIITSVIYDIDSFYTNASIIPQTGNFYKIIVQVPGYKVITANSYIPEKVHLNSLKKELTYIGFNTEILEQGIPVYTINFSDPNESNYYLFSVYSYNKQATSPNEYKIPVHYSSNDPVIGKFDNKTNQYELLFAFSDWMFNGKEYDLTFFIDEQQSFYQVGYIDSLEFIVSLNNLSLDFEYFVKSLLESEKNKENPLSEPVSIYSNINNGLGIFAGYASSKQNIIMYNKNN